METKTYSLVTNAGHSEAIFVMGGIFGERHKKEEAVIYVFSDAAWIPDHLRPYAYGNDKELLESGVAVLVSTSCVEDTIRLFESAPYRIHVVFYMPGYFQPCHDGFGNVAFGLPVLISNDVIRRIIRNPEVNRVTIFVDKE